MQNINNKNVVSSRENAIIVMMQHNNATSGRTEKVSILLFLFTDFVKGRNKTGIQIHTIRICEKSKSVIYDIIDQKR